MTRITLAVAAALFATTSLFTPAAEACISCNYTPEVVNTPTTGQAKRHQQKRSQAAKKRAPAAAKSQAARKAPPARAKAPAVAKAEPSKDAVAKAEPAETETSETGPRLTGSSALMQQSARKKEEPVAAADAEGACKKFIPAVGATVSVPCE